MTIEPWTGAYLRQALGIGLHTDRAMGPIPLEALVGLALRRNPRRAHLLVSRVLAKHVPTDPALAIAAAGVLGVLVSDRLSPAAGRPTHSDGPSASVRAIVRQLAGVLKPGGPPPGSVEQLRRSIRARKTGHPHVATVGYAETATALGQLVADTIGSYYVHSTRHAVDGAPAYAAFEEGHSHATTHRLVPTDGDWLRPGGTIVLVDDELSTGSTVVNTIRELHALAPQSAYLVATLVDLRSPADRAGFAAVAAELRTTVSVVALASGTIELPRDILARAHTLIQSLPAPVIARADPGTVEVVRLDAASLDPIRSARFGARASAPTRAADVIAGELRVALGRRPRSGRGRGILVLGTEEFISLPLAVADRLHLVPGPTAGPPADEVRFSTTTRSPIAALDRPDYAVASTVGFRSHDAALDGPGTRFAHNLTRGGRRFDTIVLLPEPGTGLDALTGPGSVTEALSGVCDRVLVVLLPADIPVASDWTPRTP